MEQESICEQTIHNIDRKDTSFSSGACDADDPVFVSHFKDGKTDFMISSARTPRGVSPIDGIQALPTPPDGNTEPDIWYDVSSGFDRHNSYAPVIVNRNLQCERSKDFNFKANQLGSQLNLPGWYHELKYENDTNLYNYLLFGIENGFLIVDE